VPLARPAQGRWLGTSCHLSSAARATAVVERVRACVAAGRPVLVGTGSVAASQTLSARLDAAGIAHQVLNAVQDADEADRIAAAGRAGAVTVATNIAGRGTDIRLDGAARAAGGLHVVLALANRSRRIDRQLLGRGARHGDPGSAERMLALDDDLLAQWPRLLLRAAARLADAQGRLPGLLGLALLAPAQRRCEWQDRLLRRDLRLADDGLADNYRISGGVE
jgi:preprotein translocase subunit SecA